MGINSSSTFGRGLRAIFRLLPVLVAFSATSSAHAQAAGEPAAPPAPSEPVPAAVPETPKPETPKPEAPKPETPKPEAPKPEAPKPEAPSTETAPPEHAQQDAPANGSAEPVVGTGYHPFDKFYVLAGLNAQIPNDGLIGEVELSAVPFVSRTLFWFGGYATIGAHFALEEEAVDPEKDAFRWGAGLEAGYRFLAVDGGYVFDKFQKDAEHRLRFRAGLSIADETFTGKNAKYSRCCCHQQDSATSCECDRNPVGLSLFLYWAVEHARDVSDHMFGLSLKLGWGL